MAWKRGVRYSGCVPQLQHTQSLCYRCLSLPSPVCTGPAGRDVQLQTPPPLISVCVPLLGCLAQLVTSLQQGLVAHGCPQSSGFMANIHSRAQTSMGHGATNWEAPGGHWDGTRVGGEEEGDEQTSGFCFSKEQLQVIPH